MLWENVIAKSETLKKYAAANGAQFAPVAGDAALGAAMPAIKTTAWQLHDAGKSKVAPDTVGIPKLRVGSKAASERGRPSPSRKPAMEDEKPSPFTDLVTGAAWFALAAFIVVCAWQMDRLKHLQATIYTVPGLVPGMLGAVIGLTSVILMVRAVRAGALAEAAMAAARFPRALASDRGARPLSRLRDWPGRPWPAVLARRRRSSSPSSCLFSNLRNVDAHGTLPRGVLVAVTLGVVAALTIHYVFQDVFLVRLP